MRWAVLCASAILAACQKNPPLPPPALGTLAVDLYIHPESAGAEDVLLQTAIRRRLSADPATAAHVQVRVVSLEVVLTGNVPRKDVSERAEQIARTTKVTVDGDPPIVAGPIKNLIKVGLP